MIILDSDVLIEILDKHSKRGEEAEKLLRELDEELVTTSLCLHEVLYGFLKASKSTKTVDNITVIGFEKEDAHLSAKLELAAERRGRPIPRMDALIAAIAMNKKATLYTFNKQHFETLKKDGLMLLE